MEAIISFLNGAVENWKLGLAAFLLGAAIVAADYFGFPHPDILGGWVGVATGLALTGLAILITALVGILVDHFRQKREDQSDEKAEGESAIANIESLTRPELVSLYTALAGFQQRFNVDFGSPGQQLAQKKIFRAVSFAGHSKIVCEVHPAILRERSKLLPALKAIAESLRPTVAITRSKGRWNAIIN